MTVQPLTPDVARELELRAVARVSSSVRSIRMTRPI